MASNRKTRKTNSVPNSLFTHEDKRDLPLAQFLASRLAATGKRDQVVVTHVPLSFDAELKDDFFNAFAQSCVRASKTKHVVLIGLEFTETDLLNFKTEVML
jgi:hypothetical protein